MWDIYGVALLRLHARDAGGGGMSDELKLEELSEAVAVRLGWRSSVSGLDGKNVLIRPGATMGTRREYPMDWFLRIENAYKLMEQEEWPFDESVNGHTWFLACDGGESWWVDDQYIMGGVRGSSMIGLYDNPAEAICRAFLTIKESE